MFKQFGILVLFAATVCGVVFAVPQKGSTNDEKSVPEEYLGNWICQTALPGYNIVLPNTSPTQPATTPPTVAIIKFTLKTDGSYEVPSAKGHYSFDSVKKTITWLDGPHEKTMTNTEIGKRDNGAPKIGLVMNKRYYGCYMPKQQRKS